MNDIVVDNCYACTLNNAKSSGAKDFIKWLKDSGVLAVSNFLLNEYRQTSPGYQTTVFIAILDHLTKNSRIIKFTKNDLKRCKISNGKEKHFKSNIKDRNHIKLVLLSERKLLVSLDKNLVKDVNSLKGCCASTEIENISY